MKYRKKPVEVWAELYKDGMEDGFDFCEIFTGKFICSMTKEEMQNNAWPKSDRKPFIVTPNGKMRVDNGDYVVTDSNGDRYPCKSAIFEQTYEPV